MERTLSEGSPIVEAKPGDWNQVEPPILINMNYWDVVIIRDMGWGAASRPQCLVAHVTLPENQFNPFNAAYHQNMLKRPGRGRSGSPRYGTPPVSFLALVASLFTKYVQLVKNVPQLKR